MREFCGNLMDRATLADVAKGLPLAKREISSGFIGGEGI